MPSAAVLLLAPQNALADALERELVRAGVSGLLRLRPDELARAPDPSELRAVVYLPSMRAAPFSLPDLREAERVFAALGAPGTHLIVISSAQVYGASPRNPGFMRETRPRARDAKNAISHAFFELESAARAHAGPSRKLTILRPCPVPLRGADDYFSRLFGQGAALTLAGYDPSIQLLHPSDFARALACALERSPGGVYNLAPEGTIPLRKALALCARPQIALPHSVQSAVRELHAKIAPTDSIAQLEFIRYSFTLSNRKSRRELGFVPEYTSAQALEACGAAPEATSLLPGYDDFGLDREYIARAGRLLFDFMARRYWRIEVEGLEHVPTSGKAVLAGSHRGLIAWDAVMVMHILAERLGRNPRFLVHPTAFAFPFVFDLTTKLGGLLACQENADYVLEHGELLGIFPEGMRGVFSLYKEAYRLRKFGRHDFVKIALRNRSKIVPFVIVGSAETYPILGKLDWRWLQRKTAWPFLPLTPTLFPLMPAPLPSKWTLRFLPPVELGDQPSHAAKDSLLVRTISDAIKRDMQAALDALAAARKSVFSG